MRRNVPQGRRVEQNKKRIVSTRSSINPPSSCPIRVFITDQHEIVRVGLRALLQGEKDIEVVGEADNAENALSGLRYINVDVVVLESVFSAGSTSGIYKKLFETFPRVRIIGLIENSNATAFLSVVKGGAQGYLRKTTSQIELVRAIRTVAKGSSYLSPEATDQTFHLLRQLQNTRRSRSVLDRLSPQERRTMTLIAEGNTNKEIATKLVLSDKTVKNYIANIFTKLEVERRTQAVALYLLAQQQQMPTGEER